jgi:hypothetical protein
MPGIIWTRWKVLAKIVMLHPAAYAINLTPVQQTGKVQGINFFYFFTATKLPKLCIVEPEIRMDQRNFAEP